MLLAGSFMHFALAFVLLFLLAVAIGVPGTNSIGAITKCLPRSVKALDTGAACAQGQPASPAERGRDPGQ